MEAQAKACRSRGGSWGILSCCIPLPLGLQWTLLPQFSFYPPPPLRETSCFP